jgi:N6-L-threonylcarbamoyladenine synthase
MRILAIETSCDETAIALIEASGGLRNPKFKILKNLVASQIKIHAPYGGVVPNLAKREHLRNLPILLQKTFNIRTSDALNINGDFNFGTSDVQKLKRIDLIAVTVGPGLEPALWTGINFAKDLYAELKTKNQKLKTKLVGVSHLDGHLYSSWFTQSYEAKPRKIGLPAVALIVSGGHTILLLMKSLASYKKLGETRDDAVGESFDKVARLLNLPYPGGPEIEKLAQKGNPAAINFPRPMLNQKNYDFSFSGLKTAVLYYLRDSKLRIHPNLRKNEFVDSHKFVASHRAADIAASFQKAAFDVLINKTIRAAKEFKAKSIMVSGGVASNFSLRKNLKLKIKNQKSKIQLIAPPAKFCLDNAAMVAAAGYINFLRKKNYKLEAQGNLSF